MRNDDVDVRIARTLERSRTQLSEEFIQRPMPLRGADRAAYLAQRRAWLLAEKVNCQAEVRPLEALSGDDLISELVPEIEAARKVAENAVTLDELLDRGPSITPKIRIMNFDEKAPARHTGPETGMSASGLPCNPGDSSVARFTPTRTASW
jgi:hypothetical protein